MNSTDLQQIRDGLADCDRPVGLVLCTGEDESPLAAQLVALSAEVERAADGQVEVGEGRVELPGLPGLVLAAGDDTPIRYLANPEGHQAAPFVEALVGLASARRNAPSLGTLTEPAELLVFVATGCPHCPHAVRAATRLALASPQVTATVVDAQWFPELAERYGVRSVPVTLVDRELTLLGVVTPDELAARIVGRSAPDHRGRVFASLVEAGRHAAAAAQLVDGAARAAFLSAWRGSTTFERVGLMLVAEEALELDEAGLDGLVGDLVAALEAPDGALRGDTADLLGQIGHPGATSALEALLQDDNPDVVEIATDALEAIGERD